MAVPAHDAYLTHLADLRASLRCRRLMWLVTILLLVYTLDLTEHWLMHHLDPILTVLAIWLIGTVIIVWLSVRLWTWVDYGMSRTMAVERERLAVLDKLHQLEAAQATGLAIAHNLNQPITVIIAYTQIYLDTPLAERDDADLREILRAAERAATLVHQFQSIEQYRTVRYAGGRPMLDLSPADCDSDLYR